MNIYEYVMMGGGGVDYRVFIYYVNLLCIYFFLRFLGDYWFGFYDVNVGSSREFYWYDCWFFFFLDWSCWDFVGDELDNFLI